MPPDKTLASFDFEATPMVSKAQIMAFASGDVRLKGGASLLNLAQKTNGIRREPAHLSTVRRFGDTSTVWGRGRT